jgi:hypothetical protein
LKLSAKTKESSKLPIKSNMPRLRETTSFSFRRKLSINLRLLSWRTD